MEERILGAEDNIENIEKEMLKKKSGVTDAGIFNRLQEMEERISGPEDNTDNIDKTFKRRCKNHKAPNPKYSGDLGHNEKIKPKDNRNRRG